MIKNKHSLTTSHVFVMNCTFELISAEPCAAIIICVSPFNKTVSFSNCKFCDNKKSITKTIVVGKACEVIDTNAIVSTNMMLTNISFVKCQFISNIQRLIAIENGNSILSNLIGNILFEPLIISHNDYVPGGITVNTISITTIINVHINGTFNVTSNRCQQAIVHL